MVISDKTYTIAEFEEYATAHPDLLLELIDGGIVEKVTSEEHAKIVGWLVHLIIVYLKTHHEIKGHWGVEASYKPVGDDQNERRPDVSLRITGDSVSKKSHVEGMPDFAVEMKSINNSYDELRDKAKFYIANGTRLVWLVYPTRRIVEVYFADGTSELFKEEHTLSGGDALPEFEVKVSDIFDL